MYRSLAFKTNATQGASGEEKIEQIVTPWDVEAADENGIDYNKLIEQFGSKELKPELIARMEVPLHIFLVCMIQFLHIW